MAQATSARSGRGQAIGLAGAVLLLSAVGVILLDAVRRLAADAAEVDHSRIVLASLDQLEGRLLGAVSQQRLFLLLADQDSLASFALAREGARQVSGELSRQVSDNPPQQARASALGALVERRLEVAAGVARLRGEQGLAAAVDAVRDGEGLLLDQQIAAHLATLRAEELRLLGQRREDSAESNQRLALQGSIGLALATVLLLGVFFWLKQENRQRRRAEEAGVAARLALQRSVSDLEQQEQWLRMLSEHAALLQSCLSEDEALRVSAATLARVGRDWGGALYLLRASRDYAERALRWGPEAADGGESIGASACWALRRGAPHRQAGAEQGVRCAHIVEPEAPDAQSLCMPVMAQGEVQGLLFLTANGTPTVAVESMQRLAESVSHDLALTLNNLRLRESLRRQSIRDPLTGLFNRRYLDESLAREVGRCRRRGRPVALLMCDLDHFKRLNDSFGHEAGDEVLKAFGQILGKAGRSEDIPCRYGGEEFLLILPEADDEVALGRAERIRQEVESLRIEYRGRAVGQLSVSIGLACAPADGEDEASLLRAADAALYRAKRAGRNRIERAAAEPDQAALEDPRS